MKKKIYCGAITVALIMSPFAVQADISPHNRTNWLDSFAIYFPDGTSTLKSDCAMCHSANYTSKCGGCHTNTSGGGYGNMVGWDSLHNYVTDSAPAMATHRDLACGDCHVPVSHDTLANIVNNKLVTGTFVASTVVNTLMSTDTWMPDPAVWTDTNGDPALGVVQEQWTSTITINSGYSVLASDWTDPSLWMEKTGPERGLILGVLNTAGTAFDSDLGSFEVKNVVVNGNGTVTLTVKGKVVIPGLYGVDQTTPAFALYYYQMIKPFIGYCDDPNQPGDQIDTANPQICFDLMGGNLYGSSNCPDGVTCIRQPVVFTGPSDFAASDGLASGGNDSTPNGICQVCHLSTSHWRRDGSLGNHYNGQSCTDCHDHKTGFQPSCTLCHAMPPVDAAGLVTDPSPTGSVTAGAHGLHAAASGYNYSCMSCHQGGMPDSAISGNNKIQIGFGVNPTGVLSSYDGQFGISAPFSYEGTGDTVVTTGGSLTCSNVYCHSNGSSVSGSVMNSNTTPAWNGNGPLSCAGCHPYPMSYGATDPRKDTHTRHAQAGYGNCALCHSATTVDGATISDRARHANLVYDVVPSATFQGRAAANIPLAFNYTFAPGGGTCSSNSCHAYWGYSDPVRWGMNVDLVVTPYVSALQSQNVNRTFTFNASRSSCYEMVSGVAEPRTCSYEWDFGGNGAITGGNGSSIVTYQYAAVGNYNATLTMRESVTNKTNSKTLAVSAVNVMPESISEDFATTVNGKTVMITAANLPANVVRAYIYWGDRKTTLSTNPLAELATGITHAYSIGNREYSIRVQAIDSSYKKVDYTVTEDQDLLVSIP
ncbi:MAG: CxxxxCH/CxxCH domain-containing protein [Pseudomonadota bacterium]